MSADGPRLRVGHCGHRGQQRKLNEDSYLVLTKPAVSREIAGLFAVADGMGGHRAGDVASQMVAESLETLFTTDAYQERVAYSPQHADYFLVVLKEALEQINESIYERAAGRRDLQGMGTTATVALLTGWRLFLGHVGDSRAYLLRGGTFQKLTRDHTWVAEQVGSGRMTAEQAAQHPRRSELLQSLGNSLLVRVERTIHTVRPNDTLLLCSDGLSGVVSDSETKAVLTRASDPQSACEQLVALANRRGGPDNITALVVQLRANGAPSNIPGGRVLGPRPKLEAEPPADDTLKLRQSAGRSHSFATEWSRPLGAGLLLLAAAVVSGLTGWLSTAIPFSDRLPAPTVAAVAAFVLGALVGRLLGCARADDTPDGESEDTPEGKI